MEESSVDHASRISSDFSNGKKQLWNFELNSTSNSSSSSSSSTSSASASSSSSILNDKLMLSAIKASYIIVLLVILAYFVTPWFHQSSFAGNSMQFTFPIIYNDSISYPKRDEYIINCTSSGVTITCPANYPPKSMPNVNFRSSRTCPEYFRWIHEDLKIWKEKGIERQMIEMIPKNHTHFRLVIVNGTAYVQRNLKCPITRDDGTLWGILQLLKLYPGRLPDLDMVFQWDDIPSATMEKYRVKQLASIPPIFRYCRNDSTFEIIFPDWSYWGWSEIAVKPWATLVKDLKEANLMMNWTDRKPYAFWKGALFNGNKRYKLVECASIEEWNAEIIHQSWSKEFRAEYKHSKLSKQCVHRYKIYIEGVTWSASEKYILACDSTTLLVEPVYYDFFSRDLIPMKHYWPININNLCKSIKFAVNWGNNNTNKAQEIGKAGSEYVFEKLEMENVYDYMFHLLNEYAKLLKYKPTVPEGAVELCSEKYICHPKGHLTDNNMESMANGAAEEGPCNLPPPFDPNTLQTLRDQKANIKEVVALWENGSGLD